MNSDQVVPDRVKQAVVLLYLALVLSAFDGYLQILQPRQALPTGVAISVLLVGLAINLFIIRMVARGRNWARVALLVLFVLGAVVSLVGKSRNVTESPIPLFVALAGMILQAMALVLLFQKRSSAWFKSAIATGLFLVLTGLASVAGGGVPPIVHLGQVLDASTGEPLAGVRVRGVYDDWPADATKRWTLQTQTDSLGVYGVTLNRPGEIHFAKAGYDSVVLHWPEEFGGVERGGCDVSLEPVRLYRTRK